MSGVRRALALVAGILLVLLAGVTGPGSPSAAAQASAPKVTPNLDYGAAGDRQTQLDVVEPTDGKTNRPAVVVVHGGGWTGGSRAETLPDATALAQHGFVAFSIDYHLDVTPRWPTELEDVQRAVRWVQDNAATYGVDPSNVGILGSSAGGNLAMLVGTDGTGDGHAPVKAVASWSGPTNLTTISITNIDGATLAAPPTVPIPGAQVPNGCVGDAACIGMLGPNYIQAFMDCTLPECPEQYRDASPVFKVSSSTPPMFLAGAEVDLVPMEQNYEMANALTVAGVASQLMLVAGEQHGDSFRNVATQPTIDFFTAYLVRHQDPLVAKGSPPATASGSDQLPPFDADGRLPVPAIPAEAAPREGLAGLIARHRSLSIGLGAAIAVVAAALVIALVSGRRRASR
jgi:acetyl esterase